MANTANGTDVLYNGITLRDVLTKSFWQENVYDKSGTDVLYTKFRVSVVTFVSDSQLSYLGADTINGTAVENMRSVRAKLLEPRGLFKMFVGRQILLGVNNYTDVGPGMATKGGVSPDANNGPKPLHCSIEHISAAKTFRIEFEIELAVVECQSAIQNSNGILSNRWSYSESYNANFFSTRTIHGQLRAASAAINLQTFRSLVMPAVPSGYRRDSMTFTTDPDGLTVDYTITDKQMKNSAPFPATDWSGTDTIASADGATVDRVISLRLSGPPSVKKVDLLSLAIRMGMFKLEIGDIEAVQAEGHPVLKSFALVDHMESNVVEFNMRVLSADKETSWQFLTANNKGQIRQSTIGSDFSGYKSNGQQFPGFKSGGKEYDKNKWTTPVDVGMDTVTGLFICFLQSPCDDNHDINAATPTKANVKPPVKSGKDDSPTVYTFTGPTATGRPSDNTTTLHKKNIYTFYQIENDYPIDNINVQLPIATQKPTSDDTSAVVVLGGGMAKRRIHITAERCGDWPDIPEFKDYTSGTLKGTLLNSSISPFAPKLMVDGVTKQFHLEATLIYALNRLPTTAEKLASGSLPWTKDTPDGDAMPGSVAKPGIAN